MPRRHLPVLAAKPSPKGDGPPGEGPDDRPPSHWIGFGAVALFAAWLPLSALAGALGQALARGLGYTPGGPITGKMAAAIGLPQLLAAFAAALGAGYLVGRFGGRTTPREAALAGVAASVFAIGLAAYAGGFHPALAVVAAPLIGGAALGGRLGTRARDAAPSP